VIAVNGSSGRHERHTPRPVGIVVCSRSGRSGERTAGQMCWVTETAFLERVRPRRCGSSSSSCTSAEERRLGRRRRHLHRNAAPRRHRTDTGSGRSYRSPVAAGRRRRRQPWWSFGAVGVVVGASGGRCGLSSLQRLSSSQVVCVAGRSGVTSRQARAPMAPAGDESCAAGKQDAHCAGRTYELKGM